MQIMQQLSQLLSQSPGNVVFHLVTLFALQAVFAIALGHWRRNREDAAIQRMMWAAAAILLARVWLLIAGLIVASNPAVPPILPPLEQALHTLTAVFLIWSFAPQSNRWPRLGDTILIIALIFIGVLYVFFAQVWRDLAVDGANYADSRQALFWAIFQITILVIGFGLTLLRTNTRRSLRPIILFLLLLAHVAQLALPLDRFVPEATDTAVWLRFGHLIIFPLWVALVYRHTLFPLLQAQRVYRPATDQLTEMMHISANLISSLQEDEIVLAAVKMIQRQIGVPFTGIALIEADNGELHLISNLPQPSLDRPQSWYLKLRHWPALRMAIEHQQTVELVPDGLGARQLYQLYEEMGLPLSTLAPLLIQPLSVGSTRLGVLMMAREAPWTVEIKAYIEALADYVAQAIVNGRLYTQTRQIADNIPILATAEPVGQARLIALEEENKRLQEEISITSERWQQEQQRAATARQQARDLAATIAEMERVSDDDRTAVLESEIDMLRESLMQAEEAVAMASAADSGLSTEWVMHAITRYSGELEEAQSRIEYLELELRNRRDDSPRYEIIASLAEEIRTPLTSIAGYTDLLLNSPGIELGTRQRDFLQRVRTNTERLNTLLNQLIQLASVTEVEPVQPELEMVDVREVVESAVHNVISRIQNKNLRLDMNIPDDLERLHVNREALQQIMINLLNNACQSSQPNGRIAINAATETIATPDDNTPVGYMRLTVADSGRGISGDDRARVFDPQLRVDHPLIEGLGDTAAGLAVARTLTQAYGGRIWVDSELGQGSIFSVVFPLISSNGIH
jgi:signal transduction histidine kinase